MVARNKGEFEAPDNLEKQALAQRQCPAREGVAEVMNSSCRSARAHATSQAFLRLLRRAPGLAPAITQGLSGGRTPGRPPLDPDTISAAHKLIDAGLSPAQAAKQLGIGRATAYRIAASMREGRSSP